MSLSVQEILLAAWKRCLSFRKSDWELKDYPVVIRKQQHPDDPARSASLAPYQARIVNWWVMSEGGNTPQEALEDLAAAFIRTKDNKRRDRKSMPRPGTHVPIEVELASTSRVDAHVELTDDFIKRVLGLPWAFVSDQSSLWDFHTSESNSELNARIQEIYGVDVSDVESGNLATILERIASSRAR